MRGRLLAIGAESLGRCHEHNLRFEDAGRGLARRRMLLRLRRDRKSTLTFKSPADGADPEFKQMHEIEVEVSDFDAARGLLAALGFHPVQCYEKWRETFRLGPTALCLDTLPFGDFIEIEGAREEIVALSVRLGLEWRRRILGNYLEIFDLLRSRHRLAFRDLTFRDFAGLKVDLRAILPLIEAGGEPSGTEALRPAAAILSAEATPGTGPPSRRQR